MPEARDAAWMQRVAREMNLSETAFLHRRSDASSFDLRWFTPTTEVDLCGHATLASAHVLWESHAANPSERLSFHTKSGVLTAERQNDWIELDFPATPDAPAEPPVGLVEALRVVPQYVGKSRFDYLVLVDNEAAVRALAPDFGLLRSVPARGVIVTSRADTHGWDFVSRFFAPAAGVDEDPVTGSAHCCLAPFWSRRLHKQDMVARQLSARGGTVRVRLNGDRVRLGGQAVTVLRGELLA
jgi:PhzF family phenazine biosynthesis protein